MSDFTKPAINPLTGNVEPAQFLDDYFGRHKYGVRFDDGHIYPEEEIEVFNEKGQR